MGVGSKNKFCSMEKAGHRKLGTWKDLRQGVEDGLGSGTVDLQKIEDCLRLTILGCNTRKRRVPLLPEEFITRPPDSPVI